MKIKKLSRTLLAAVLASAMLFTLTACDGDPEPSSTTAATSGTGGAGGPDAPGGAVGTSDRGLPTQSHDLFNFGVMAFHSQTFKVAEGGSLNVGGDYNDALRAGDGPVIRLAGFVGGSRGTAAMQARHPIPADEDQDGAWLNLISNNGEFWENVSRIEATMFFLSDQVLRVDMDGNMVPRTSSVEEFTITGGRMAHRWDQSGQNEISSFDPPEGAPPEDMGTFSWGAVMRLSWDIDKVAAARGVVTGGEYVFNSPAIDVSTGGGDPDMQGGGLNNFGFQLRNQCIDEELVVTIRWTGVTIVVHCLDTYNAHVAAVAAVDPRFAADANNPGTVVACDGAAGGCEGCLAIAERA